MKIFLDNKDIGFIDTAIGVGLDRDYYDIKKSTKSENILYITKLFVSPEFRKLGYGKMLVEKLKQCTDESKVICLDAIPLEDTLDSEILIKLYTQCGFRRAKGLLAFVYGPHSCLN